MNAEMPRIKYLAEPGPSSLYFPYDEAQRINAQQTLALLTAHVDKRRQRPGFNSADPEVLERFFNVPRENRGFEDVDDVLMGELDEAIRHLKVSEPKRVLDIAGGYRSEAARGIVSVFGEDVKVTAVDIEQMEAEVPGVTRYAADARNLPIADESQDIAYSSYFVMYLDDADAIKVLSEAARVLAPGGVAMIDDDGDRRGSESWEKEIARIKKEQGVRITNFPGFQVPERHVVHWITRAKTPKSK